MWILESTDPANMCVFRMLPGDPKTIGRSSRADFIVDAPLVSRVHCRLTLDAAGRLGVEDLGSTNGTWVNGQKVQESSLASGDRLKIGRIEFEVKATASPG
jgi:pSer/pThr/pTyr-binding forkhead associated (FHA) protein